MKKKDLQELKTKTAQEMSTLAATLKGEIKTLSFDMAQRKVKNLNEMRTKMKHRARLLTLASQKKIEEKVKEVKA